MTKISKKAILSILSLVLTFVALGATTFAWFSLGTTATVSPFELDVKGSEGLEIQFGDDSSWYSTINSTLIKGYIEGLITAANDESELDELLEEGRFIMNAVTTTTGKKFFTYGITGNSMVHGESQVAVANKDYLSLQFKLRTTAKQAINITSLSVSDNGPATSETQVGYWTADQNFTLAKGSAPVTTDPGTRLESHLTDALRVAFVVGESVVAFENGEIGTNTTGTLAKNGENYIGAFEYYAKKSGYGNTDGTITLNPASGWTPLEAVNNFGSSLNTELFTAPAGEVGEDGYYYHDVVINIWFEGYDNEAFDYVLEQMVSISMAFSLV